MKAAKKGTTDEAGRKSDAQALDLFNGLMAEKDPIVTGEFIAAVEQDFRPSGSQNVNRRVALSFLAKPFGEMAKRIGDAKREGAVAMAAAMPALKESAVKYARIAELFTAAEIRIGLALCQREDMKEILEEAKR
jgi:hypothetical protein